MALNTMANLFSDVFPSMIKKKCFSSSIFLLCIRQTILLMVTKSLHGRTFLLWLFQTTVVKFEFDCFIIPYNRFKAEIRVRAPAIFTVYICIWQDHIVCLPQKTAQQMGNISQLCIVTNVTQSMHVIDPWTLQCEYCHLMPRVPISLLNLLPCLIFPPR